MFVTLLIALSWCGSNAEAQLPLTAIDTPTTYDFSGFDGSGFSPTPAAGQLDSDLFAITGSLVNGSLAFGGTAVAPSDFARGLSTGGETIGGIYAYDISLGNVALGAKSTGDDFTPGTVTLRLRNDTGVTVTSLSVSVRACYYNNQPRSTRATIQHSVNDTAYTLTALMLDTPAAPDTFGWICVPVAFEISGLSLGTGALFYARVTIDDVPGLAGSRDEVALDDFSFTPHRNVISTDAGPDGPSMDAGPEAAIDLPPPEAGADTARDGTTDTASDTVADTAPDMVMVDARMDATDDATPDVAEDRFNPPDAILPDAYVPPDAQRDATIMYRGRDTGGCCHVAGASSDRTGLMVAALALLAAALRGRSTRSPRRSRAARLW